MSDDGQKRVTRIDVLARGPSLLTEMLSEALGEYSRQFAERMNGSEQTQGKAATIGAVCGLLAGSFGEAIVTRKIVEAEKLKADAVKVIAEANKLDQETRKLISDEEVNRATAEKLRADAMLSRATAMKTLLESLKEFADPVVRQTMLQHVLVEGGTFEGHAALSIAIDGRGLGQPAGDGVETASSAEGV